MVTIRLARHGGKKKPFYHVTVAEKSAPRDGRFVERLGFYNPVAQGKEEKLRIDLERFDHWLQVGAVPTERVGQLVKRWRKQLAAIAAVEAIGNESGEGAEANAEQAASEPSS